MNIQSTRGSGAVVNRFEELAQQGFILYIVLHWLANNNVDCTIIWYYTKMANNSVAAPCRTACLRLRIVEIEGCGLARILWLCRSERITP